jgi:hypothetical protein
MDRGSSTLNSKFKDFETFAFMFYRLRSCLLVFDVSLLPSSRFWYCLVFNDLLFTTLPQPPQCFLSCHPRQVVRAIASLHLPLPLKFCKARLPSLMNSHFGKRQHYEKKVFSLKKTPPTKKSSLSYSCCSLRLIRFQWKVINHHLQVGVDF